MLHDMADNADAEAKNALTREVADLFDAELGSEGRAEMDTVEKLSGVKLGSGPFEGLF
jgi:hypothetical protein